MNLTPSSKAQAIGHHLASFISREIEPIEAEWHRAQAALADPWQELPVNYLLWRCRRIIRAAK